MKLTNDWIRWLSVYVEFLGADGVTPITPAGWESQLPGGFGEFESDTKKYLLWCPARSTILGIPLAASPSEISFWWPGNNPSGAGSSAAGSAPRTGLWKGGSLAAGTTRSAWAGL